MSKITVGTKVPAFSAKTTDGSTWKLADADGRKVVLYFYPKDMTPGCTVEAREFRDAAADFKKAGAVVVGVSRDSCTSHAKFRDKESLNFELLSDEDEKLCRLFDVIKEKNMYGKKVMGIERSTFLIGADGKLAREWRKVKVDGHVAEVLAAARGL
ncbi:MAG: thioredoxin-dependent thiol peroxidase [Steroidobacteraceae bacterium]|jgi:peroxiredoxin Q/BCP|nr:thioredoxin-dependent thiol peroxidase [Steroidobacteraceae bacterium]